MNKYFAELVGTFFLVLTVGCTVIGDGVGRLAPLAIGSALMVLFLPAGTFREDTLIRPLRSASASAENARLGT